MNSLFILILFAHPHIFIDYTIDFVFEQDELTGIKTVWLFDEMYSSMLLQNYDVDQNGYIDKNETATMQRDAFSNLENYNYFIYITANNKCYKVKTVQDFAVDARDDRVIYEFFVPYSLPVENLYQNIEVCMYDETYYVDLWPLNDDPALFTNAETVDYKYEVFEDEKESQGYGQIYPYTTRLTFRKKQ
jgi:ABC-type uncharacterized transport system substrate-binding protein